MHKFLLLLVLASCAHREQSSEFEYSKGAVLDLAKTSYLKGCVDILKLKEGKTYGKNHKICLDLSANHQKEIKEILK